MSKILSRLRFTTLMTIVLMAAVAYCLGLLVYAGMLSNQLKIVTARHAYTSSGGPSGLVKTFYIKTISGHYEMTGHSDTSRNYIGLTISKLLYPGGAINKEGTVTFYALYTKDKKTVTHFAATAGTAPASIIRLYIDVCSYLMSTYYYLYLIIFLLIVSLKDVYKLINGKDDVEDEVATAYNQSVIGRWHNTILVVLLLFLVL